MEVVDTPWRVAEKERNVHTISFDGVGEGWSQYVLLSSDRHWDNPHSDQKMQYRHLEQAKDRNAPVIDLGDFFCAMQGRNDRRSNKSDIRPEHNVENYFDALVSTAVEAFKPYAHLFVVIGSGNHDTAIIKHNETDLVARMVHRLNVESGSNIANGGYSGWVVFQFTMRQTVRQAVNLFRHHGYGGGGPVTKGTIQTARRAAYLPDAHIIASGHIHESWTLEVPRARISSHGKHYQDKQVHVQVPSYKEEYDDGFGGFHIEKGRPPKPVGATWLRFYYEGGKVKYDTERAE